MLLTELKTATQPAHQQLHRIINLDRLQSSLDEYVRCLLGFFQSIAPIERLLMESAANSSSSEIYSPQSGPQPELGDVDPLVTQDQQPRFITKTEWLLTDLRFFGCQPRELCGLFDKRTGDWLKQFLDSTEARQQGRRFTPQNSDWYDTLLNDTESHKIGLEPYQSNENTVVDKTAGENIVVETGRTTQPQLDLADQIGMRYVLEGMTLGSTRIFPKLLSAHGGDREGSRGQEQSWEHRGLTQSRGLRFFRAYGELPETQRRWEEFKGWAESQAEQQNIDRTKAVAAATRTFHRFAAILGKWLPAVEGSTR